MPASAVLEGWETVQLTAEDAVKIRNGIAVAAPQGAAGRARAIGPDGELLAVLEADPVAGNVAAEKSFHRPVDSDAIFRTRSSRPHSGERISPSDPLTGCTADIATCLRR